MKKTIGLFGTCGQSTWRKDFIDLIQDYDDFTYFNPQLPEGEWTPECADIENQHFKTDELVLFPVTDETTAFGSLGEVGFSIQSLLEKPNQSRYFVFFIDDLCQAPNASSEAIQDSQRMRKLVKSKVQEINHPRIFLADSLQEMEWIMLDLMKLISIEQEVYQKYKGA